MQSRRRLPDLVQGTPFKFALRNEFPGRERKIMRLARDGRIVRLYRESKDGDWTNLQTFVIGLRQDGLAVPDYDRVVAPDPLRPNRTCNYLVLESIAGERIDEVIVPRSLDWNLRIPRLFYHRFFDALDEFCLRLFDHYERIRVEGGLLFTAMDQSQFIYGNTRTSRRPAVYFVDLDPTYRFVPPADELPETRRNEFKAEFEKPLGILFEIRLLQPEAPLTESVSRAKDYFGACDAFFLNFYDEEKTPRWARPPNFVQYQRLKRELLGCP